MKHITLTFPIALAASLSLNGQTIPAAAPAALETVSPNIYVRDIRQTVEYYKLMGFDIVATVPDTGNPIFVMMRCGGVTFMFQTFESIGSSLPLVSRKDGGSLLLYIKVKNIRALFDKLKDKVTILHGLQKTFYGATEFSVQDNNHYLLTFAEYE